jgi:hypothetical protein
MTDPLQQIQLKGVSLTMSALRSLLAAKRAHRSEVWMPSTRQLWCYAVILAAARDRPHPPRDAGKRAIPLSSKPCSSRRDERVLIGREARASAEGASFVSVTQQFNTTSSMGRLTLNVLLSFAQFEREVTGECIRDKIAASKKKGMRITLPPASHPFHSPRVGSPGGRLISNASTEFGGPWGARVSTRCPTPWASLETAW